MFNSICIFITLLLFFGLTSVFVFNKSTTVVIVIMECLVLVSYILAVYLSSVTDDPRLATCALLLLVIASVEVVYFIIYISRV